MCRQITLGFVPGLVAAALLTWGCDRPESPASPRGVTKPSFGMETMGCPAVKMTGGGRIDFPPGTAQKNPPASHMYQTFGAHVISSPDQMGNCVRKGSLEWVDHSQRPNGRPLNLHSIEITFADNVSSIRPDCRDGAVHWGGRLVRKNDGMQSSFEVFDCDDGEPGVGHDGFGIRAPEIGYDVTCTGPLDPHNPACILTGGNRQFHPTH